MREAELPSPLVLVLGSERGELPEDVDAAVRIPVHADSLNVAMAATAALYEDSERRIYDLLIQRLPDAALVSIAHRPGVVPFHRRHLVLSADGFQAGNGLTEKPTSLPARVDGGFSQ